MTPIPRADDAAVFWRRRARRTTWRHNFGGVPGGFLPPRLGAVFARALLVARQHGVAGRRPWTVYGGALLVCAGTAGWLARRRGFFSATDALVRLEWHLGLTTA